MPNLKDITKGADLTKPRLSLGWILPAIVGVAILGVVWHFGSKLSSIVTSTVSKTTGEVGEKITGMFGTGK